MSSSSRAPEEFVALFRYDQWASARIIDALQSAEAPPERAVELLDHLIRAQDVWYGRVQNTDHADRALWGAGNLAACVEQAEASAQRWHSLLEQCSAADLDRAIAYTNSEGTAFETPLRDILTHVVNHGTHHRAQIALLLREADIAPPPTDYIFFVREE